MAWRDEMRRVTVNGREMIGARFRGATFLVDVGELAGGRKTVAHEYPQRDTPFVEDLGLRGRSFPIEGYVIGTDYLAGRDALIAALETRGVGELVHPFYGTRRVICAAFRVRETRDEGGLARFSIDFLETPAQPVFPSAADDGAALVGASANAGIDATELDFEIDYDVTDQPQFGLDSIVSIMQSATEEMRSVLSPVVSATEYLASLNRTLDALFLDADALVRQPLVVAARFATAIRAIFAMPSTPRLSIKALLKAYGFSPSVTRPPATTTTRRREQTNYDAMQRMIQRTTVVEAARLAPTADYDSYEDALSVRNEIVDKLDEQADTAGDTLYAALVQLRADVVKAVPGDDNGLARLVAYTPHATVPSLVLSHELYGGVSMEADVLARNRIRRPGFVNGGTTLEVLSSA